MDILRHQFPPHQAEGRVGVLHFHAEDHLQQEAHDAFDKLPVLPVPPVRSVADDGFLLLPGVPEALKFRRIRLAVGIRLENPVRTLICRVLISVQHGGSVAPVLLAERHQQRPAFRQLLQLFTGPVLRPVVDDQQPRAPGPVMAFHHRVPVVHALFDIFFFVVGRDHNIQRILFSHAAAPSFTTLGRIISDKIMKNQVRYPAG